MKTRHLFVEALNPCSKVANSIAKKLNYMETSLILDSNSYENSKVFLDKICNFYSNTYDEMNEEDKNEVTEKLYNIIHNSLQHDTKIDENTDNDLENKIYIFLKQHGGILYPLKKSASTLANIIKKK